MLVALLESHGFDVPPVGADLGLLTPFAVILHYDEFPPDDAPPSQPRQLVVLAEQMLTWAERSLVASS